MSQVKPVIHDVLKDIAEEESLSLPQIQGHETLVEDLGFRSLTMARILAILEGRFGVDPFSKTVAVTSIRTVDDLCAAYEQCLLEDNTATTRIEDSVQFDQIKQRAASRLDAARSRARHIEETS